MRARRRARPAAGWQGAGLGVQPAGWTRGRARTATPEVDADVVRRGPRSIRSGCTSCRERGADDLSRLVARAGQERPCGPASSARPSGTPRHGPGLPGAAPGGGQALPTAASRAADGDQRVVEGRWLMLSPAQVDRAAGVLVGAAVGDALGAGYEFGSAPCPGRPEMIGGGLGGFEPGEWTDDTAQTYAIAEVAATGADLRTREALDRDRPALRRLVRRARPTSASRPRAVLSPAGRTRRGEMAATRRRRARRTGRSAGNGSLMRTAPVALAHLDDPAAMVEAAMAVSALTTTGTRGPARRACSGARDPPSRAAPGTTSTYATACSPAEQAVPSGAHVWTRQSAAPEPVHVRTATWSRAAGGVVRDQPHRRTERGHDCQHPRPRVADDGDPDRRRHRHGGRDRRGAARRQVGVERLPAAVAEHGARVAGPTRGAAGGAGDPRRARRSAGPAGVAGRGRIDYAGYPARLHAIRTTPACSVGRPGTGRPPSLR